MYEKNDAFYKEEKIEAYYRRVVVHEAKFSLRYYSVIISLRTF